MSDERPQAKTPTPWQPHWWAHIGPVTEQGDGLLAPHLWQQKGLLEIFEVWVEPKQVRIKVDLRNGHIYFNNSMQHRSHLPPDTTYRLIWGRRMRKEMYTHDATLECKFECQFYMVGWQATLEGRNVKCGYVIQSDGEITEGLPERTPSA